MVRHHRTITASFQVEPTIYGRSRNIKYINAPAQLDLQKQWPSRYVGRCVENIAYYIVVYISRLGTCISRYWPYPRNHRIFIVNVSYKLMANSWSTTFACTVIFWLSSSFSLIDNYKNVLISITVSGFHVCLDW
jgi:hypothetical protein